MSTANFDSRQNGFPLYVHDDIYAKVCPECGAVNDSEDEVCCDCGEDLHKVEVEPDWIAEEWLCKDVGHDMEEINKDLDFFTVRLKSGYYVGVQFDVNWNDHIGDPEELNNEDAHYYFDCCRSVMLRKYERERRKLGKQLAKLAKNYGFEEIVCVGVFSNGEAIYERVGTLRAAANAI